MRYLCSKNFTSIVCAGIIAFLCGSVVGCGPQDPEPRMQEIEARVTLLNKTREMHVLRVRNLRQDVRLDCEQVRRAPDRYLRDDIFAAPVRWPLYSDQEIGLGLEEQSPWNSRNDLGGRRCSAALVQSDTVSDIVVFWDDSLEPKSFVFDPNIPEHIKPDGQTVVLQADYSEVADGQLRPYRFRPCGTTRTRCSAQQEANAAALPDGARYAWESVHDEPLHFERRWRPIDQPDEPPEACQMPGGENSLVWSDLPIGRLEVAEVSEGIDGCHTMHLRRHTNPEDTREFLVCMPFEALEPTLPTSGHSRIVRFRALSASDHDGLHIEIEAGDEIGQHRAHIFAVRGASLPPGAELEIESRVREDCNPVEASCGQVELPADALITSQANDRRVRPGEASQPVQGRPRLFLMRSFSRSVLDPICDGDPVAGELDDRPGHYFEAVVVIQN